MKRILALLFLAGLTAGCATSRPQAAANLQTGEVWGWDEQANTVTLLQRAQPVRYKVEPDQLRGLRLHEIASIRGEVAPPAEIATVITPPGAFRPVPTGTPERSEVSGTVAARTPDGLVAIDTPSGPVKLWVTEENRARFAPGTPVTLRMAVQELQLVPTDQPVPPPSPLPEPSASVRTEPGDYAVVIGRILAAGPNGTLTVDAPHGPIVVWLPDASRYHVGETVQVRTSLHTRP